jgi:hypothetical protein
MNIHKSSNKRNKFVCFIKNCSKSYLYVCTLKKHISTSHINEYEELGKIFKEKNFLEIFNYLKKTQNFKEIDERLEFIEIKNNQSENETSHKTNKTILKANSYEEKNHFFNLLKNEVDANFKKNCSFPSVGNVNFNISNVWSIPEQSVMTNFRIFPDINEYIYLNDTICNSRIMPSSDKVPLVQPSSNIVNPRQTSFSLNNLNDFNGINKPFLQGNLKPKENLFFDPFGFNQPQYPLNFMSPLDYATISGLYYNLLNSQNKMGTYLNK